MFQDVPGLLPFRPRNGHRPGDRLSGQENVDGQPLKEYRVTTPFRGPRHVDLFHAMLGAFHAWHVCVQDGLELATVQMPPLAIRHMVKTCQRLTAFGTREPGLPWMFDMDVDLLILDVQLDLCD